MPILTAPPAVYGCRSRRDIGKYNSLAFGPDGAANISYFDEENDDLIYSRMVDSQWDIPSWWIPLKT